MRSPYPAPRTDSGLPPPTEAGSPGVGGSGSLATPGRGNSTVIEPTVGGSVRMGFGIAFGMLLFALLVGALVLGGVAMLGGVITWPFAPQAQRFEGTGPASSVPTSFGGDYRLEWTISPTSPAACRLEAQLQSGSGGAISYNLATEIVEPTGSPATFSRDMTIGTDTYVLAVESDCRWSVRFVRR
jgi:hypothetical protein